jgi:hypothetical protein
MPDQPPPRRRFKFRLRTLLIGVTLLAVVCGYVGWQAKIVNERAALLSIKFREGQLTPILIKRDQEVISQFHFFRVPRKGINHGISWLRVWLGDIEVEDIELKEDADGATLNQYLAAFPEARIHRANNPATNLNFAPPHFSPTTRFRADQAQFR